MTKWRFTRFWLFVALVNIGVGAAFSPKRAGAGLIMLALTPIVIVVDLFRNRRKASAPRPSATVLYLPRR